MPQAQEVKSGDDVSDLMNVKSGDDVTSLMNAPVHTVLPDVENKPKASSLMDYAMKAGSKLLNPIGDISSSPSPSGQARNIQGPGLMEIPGIKNAADYIRNKGINTGNWGLGALGSIIGDVIEGLSTGFDPRTAGIGHGNIAQDVRPAPPPRTIRGLLPERTLTQPSSFIAGPSGETGLAANINVTPDIAAKIAGLGEGRPFLSGKGGAFNPLEQAERNRIEGLQYGPEGQWPGSRATVPDRPFMNSPVESGDTGLGFTPQSEPSLGYPLDVIPNRLRPRTVQSMTSNLTPERMKGPLESNKGLTFEPSESPERNIKSGRTEFYGGEGTARPGEPQLPSAPIRPSRIQQLKNEVEQIPGVKSGDIPKPPISEVEKNTHPPTDAKELPIPKPGEAQPSPLAANLNSPHKILPERIVTPILDANDNKQAWTATILREFSQYSKGLNSSQRSEVFNVLNGGTSNNPLINERAAGIKQLFEMIHPGLPIGTGRFEDYITHIQKQPEDIRSAIESIFDYHGATGILRRGQAGEATGSIGDFYDKGMGNPSSPFIEPRTGNVRTLETDINKVIPAYIESVGKVMFDAPAVKQVKGMIKVMPEGTMKELATWWVKNYTRYDSEAELHNAFARFANAMATVTARSVINLNPMLHMLHVGEIPASLWPELGSKYTALGLKDFVTSPFKNYGEMARLGLLQGEIRPFQFKTRMQKLDSIMYGMSYVESFVKGVGFNGAKRMFIEQGMNESEATMKAVQLTKDLTYTVDPARSMKGFSPESNIMGGEIGSRLGGQFKQIPAKILEQYINYAKMAKSERGKFARLVAGASIAIAGSEVGAHTFHLNPNSLLKFTAMGAWGDAMHSIYQDLSKGDATKAMVDTLAWLTPGGRNIQKGLKFVTSGSSNQ